MVTPLRSEKVADHMRKRLRAIGLRPTRTRVALGNILFAKGDRHISAEMLFEEASQAKVPISLATAVYPGRSLASGRDRFPQGLISIPTTRNIIIIIWRIGTS